MEKVSLFKVKSVSVSRHTLLELVVFAGCGPVGLLAIGIAKVMGATKM